MKIIYNKINLTTGVIKDFSGNLIQDGSIVVHHKDDVAFATQFVKVDTDGTEVVEDLSAQTTIRFAGDTELAEDAEAVFTITDFNQGIDAGFEDASEGKVTHLVHLTSEELNTHMGSESQKTIMVEWSINGPAPDFYNSTLAQLEITVRAGVHQSGSEVVVSPDPTYLTAAETFALFKGVADIAALKAIPEASLSDLTEKFVASEQQDYWYDAAAVSGDETPTDQTGGTGFWKKKVANLEILDEDDMVSDSETLPPSQQSVKAFVIAQITALINSSPAALDTLAELAASLGDDDDFIGTMTTALAGKHSKAADLDLENTYILKNLLGIGATAAASKTIASGTFTQTQLVHSVLNEGATGTDDLVSVTPATGQKFLILTMGNSGQVPTIKHGTGTNQFSLQDDTDLVCKMNSLYLFFLHGTVWKLIGGSGSGAGGGGGISVAIYEDQKSSGTAAGNNSTGYQTRTLNTEVSDPDSIATLSANAVTPIAGTYMVFAYAQGYMQNGQRLAIKDGTSNILFGISNWHNQFTFSQVPTLTGLLVADGVKSYTLEHYMSVAQVNGLGYAATSGDSEVYAQLVLMRIGD